jgi:hypothetical protein
MATTRPEYDFFLKDPQGKTRSLGAEWATSKDDI